VTKSKDGTALSTRNIFCSECTPAVTVASTNPNDIQNTTLPLVLLATNVGATPLQSYATIINTENQRQGSFGIGDLVPGATGKVKEIHYKYIDFENGGHLERLVLQGQQAPVAAPVAQTEAPADGDDLQASIDSGIKKIDDTTYEIDKSLVDKVLANPMGVAKGARVVPAVQNGKPNGFKLYAIRPSSVYAKLGLTNGDTLSAINGMELTTADKALEVYTKLREATQLEVEIQRRGKPMTLKYSIR
jgi:general secretion pathway protein C